MQHTLIIGVEDCQRQGLAAAALVMQKIYGSSDYVDVLKGHGFTACRETHLESQEVSGHDFTACEKAREFSQLCIRAWLQPCRKRSKISAGYNS